MVEVKKLYIVLGLRDAVEAWRRELGLPRHKVIAVSPTRYTGVLRGLNSDFEVVTLESWAQASPELVSAVEQDLEIVRAAQRIDREPTSLIIHIAGHSITIDNRQRQRCAWCGATLLDYDLSFIAVPVGQDPQPATWPTGELVALGGNAAWLVEHKDGDRLPEGACGRIDPDVTK